MSGKLLKKENLLIFVEILLIIGLLAGGYFLIISPKITQVTMKENELKSQEQLLSVLQTQDTPTSSVTVENATALQKQVPVKPQTEQLLLDIEKAEVASGSFVSNMQFSDGEVQNQTGNEQQGNTQQNANGNAETNKQTTSLPNGLKKVTVDITIESPDYPELEKFIKTIEKSERILVVEAIDFTANDEIISDDQTDKILTSQVKLSAFYMPTLSDLIDQLPKLETPEPAHKKNPFSYFGNYAPEKVEGNYDSVTKDPTPKQENNGDTATSETPGVPSIPSATDENKDNSVDQQKTDHLVEKDGKQYKVITYKVQPGDTFFDLAITYYKNSKGFQLIMDWNHLEIPRRLQAGTLIEIPIPLDGEI